MIPTHVLSHVPTAISLATLPEVRDGGGGAAAAIGHHACQLIRYIAGGTSGTDGADRDGNTMAKTSSSKSCAASTSIQALTLA